VSADFYTEIEAHFTARRGTPFIVSAKDWSLMKKWQGEGIPLPVIIEAIDTVFEKNESSGRRKTISSLHYCRHAVKELWDERRGLYVGGAESTPEAAPEVFLEPLAADVEASGAPAEVIAAFAVRVRELAREQSVPRIEEKLIELEHDLVEAVLAALPSGEQEEVRHEVARALGDLSRLDEKTRARTEEANLRRIVRDRFTLPRLTLFR
jgi:hypothetical protein